jgi:hypothetical protein
MRGGLHRPHSGARAVADPRRREAVSTEIELDGSDPVEVCVMWLGRRILTVRRRALAGDEPLDDEIEIAHPPDQPDGRG